MVDLVQAVFEEISLERNPALWQSERDSREDTVKRLKFLADFSETNFLEALKPGVKSPGRKNGMLAKALQGKAEKAGSPTEALRLISQALCFADEAEVRDSLLRKRIELLKSSDLPGREKRRHTITALTLLGEERTNEEEELLPQLQGESQDNLEGNASLMSS